MCVYVCVCVRESEHVCVSELIVDLIPIVKTC